MELPYYRGYLADVICWNCGVTNVVFEVYRREIETNCLSCARGHHTLPDWVRPWVTEQFWTERVA